MRRPLNPTLPSVGWCRPTISLATVDLPEPDSPTRASVSPGSTEKLTRSTARRMRRGSRSSTRLSQGRETSKSRLTWSRLSSGMQPARRAAGAGGHELGAFHEAAVEAPRAARIEGAARRNGVEARHGAVDLDELSLAQADLGNGAHQPHGVGVLRGVDHVAHAAHLDDA